MIRLTLIAFVLVFPCLSPADEWVPITLHDVHPFRDYGEIEDWPARQEEIRNRILVSSGLLPFPEKTPLNAERFGAVEQEGFRVERVWFESIPGHFVTASLFTPTGDSLKHGVQDGKRPGVLCPHGHWTNGRFYDALGREGHRGALQQIARGAERFESAARNPIVARCVQLARMGCVVLAYDMIGYADAMQLPDHRRGPRLEMNSAEFGEWGFVSPMATLRLQTNFGLQTWNSVRALDYLEGLEGVDPDRLLVTGASGGATQTMVLAAIDDRVDASFPAVMVSTAMQGGCTCENSHYLRIDQGNIDIAAAFAPKPQGLTAADDWTIELETKGHPDLLSLYEGLGAKGSYEAHFDIHFFHNFNHVSRTHLYAFVNRHFDLGLEAPVLERNFTYLGEKELSVWTSEKEKPEHYREGDEHEREVNQAWAELSDQSLETNQEAMRIGWDVMLRGKAVQAIEAEFELAEKENRSDTVVMLGSVVSDEFAVDAEIHYPSDWNGTVLIDLESEATPDGGATVLWPSLTRGRNQAMTYSGKADIPEDSWQRSPVYFYGYNDSNFTRNVHEIAACVRMAREHPDWEVKSIELRGRGANAALVLAAQFLLGEEIDEVSADLEGFSFAGVDDLWSDAMVPGAVKYGDIRGLRSLAQGATP